jgi:hypothetical protein
MRKPGDKCKTPGRLTRRTRREVVKEERRLRPAGGTRVRPRDCWKRRNWIFSQLKKPIIRAVLGRIGLRSLETEVDRRDAILKYTTKEQRGICDAGGEFHAHLRTNRSTEDLRPANYEQTRNSLLHRIHDEAVRLGSGRCCHGIVANAAAARNVTSPGQPQPVGLMGGVVMSGSGGSESAGSRSANELSTSLMLKPSADINLRHSSVSNPATAFRKSSAFTNGKPESTSSFQ